MLQSGNQCRFVIGVQAVEYRLVRGLESCFVQSVIAVVDDAIDTPVFLVSQLAFVGVALARRKPLRGRIVLNDKVVPVEYPHISVWSDLGHDGSGPFVVARDQVEWASALVARSSSIDHERAN